MMMDCREFEERMDDFVAGKLPATEREAAECHLSACARCHALHESILGVAESLPPNWQDTLTAGILDRTTGPVCGVAERRLCDWIDGDPNENGGAVISLHLSHCPACSALADSLRELNHVLPEMALLQPDASFADDVLKATSDRRAAGGARPSFTGVRQWWRGMMQRPRFAWEAAYVGALLVLIALGSPASLLQRMPETLVVPGFLVRGGDQLVRQTAATYEVTQEAAQRSFNSLRLRSRDLWLAASDLPLRTTAALRQKASDYIKDLKAEMADGAPEQESPRKHP
jgi:anti-sigma factor RsiW